MLLTDTSLLENVQVISESKSKENNPNSAQFFRETQKTHQQLTILGKKIGNKRNNK